MIKKILAALILLLILIAAVFMINKYFYNTDKIYAITNSSVYETSCGKYQSGKVKIDSKILSVDVALGSCKLELGLSGKISMKEDEGMIFAFEKAGNYGFWMKKMNFPLDILWIDDNFNIVGIEKDLATSTYPQSFGEEYFSRYVLEVSAGYSDKNNIKVGDKIIFSED